MPKSFCFSEFLKGHNWSDYSKRLHDIWSQDIETALREKGRGNNRSASPAFTSWLGKDIWKNWLN